MLTVNPETFEVIEEAFFLAENMDDGMTVIQKCPSAVSAAFDIQRLISCLAESEIQILDNCLNLWRIISMDDDEVVSQDADSLISMILMSLPSFHRCLNGQI